MIVEKTNKILIKIIALAHMFTSPITSNPLKWQNRHFIKREIHTITEKQERRPSIGLKVEKFLEERKQMWSVYRKQGTNKV